jgi:lysyl-tRNA synthetase class 2
MIKTRDEYLSKFWMRYPEMPEGALGRGRVLRHHLGNQSVADWVLITTNTEKASAEKIYKGTDVLIDGDLIALMPQNKILLLAPNLKEKNANGNLWPEHKKWQNFISIVRELFAKKNFLEVMTPTLVVCPGTEPSLEVFRTEFKLGLKSKNYFLPTSPELNLKKLLAEGAENIFEIARVFRNGEITERHHPEFIMLEWYRAFSNLAQIKLDVLDLVSEIAEKVSVKKPTGVLSFTIRDLFMIHCDFDLKPDTTLVELKNLADKLNVDVRSAKSIDDYFYLIFIEKIENKWPKDHLVFVEKYPPYQAALARIAEDGWAERFEFYWQGYEIGNAFHELNDPVIQLERANQDVKLKLEMGKSEIPLDPAFFEALNFGLPPAAGIAVGLERLYMAMTGIQNISLLKQIYNSTAD